jgi:NOL1/NOP2/fmu family ribosome biogenesis protein
VVDAPCSGEGMFRKGDMARREWSEENARHCAVRQQRIIKDAWDTLKEGEWLIYSTCTYNANENEKNIKWLLNQTDAEVARLEVPDDWGIVGIPVGKGNALAFYPHSVKGEGFFIVLVQKNQSVKSLRIPKYKPQKIKTPADIRQLLKDEGLFAYFENEERWTAFPKYYEKSLMMLQNQLRVLYSGVTLANTRAKSLIPDIALALSWHYNAVYPVLELEQYDALRYLKGEMPEIRSGIQRGFILVTYNQIPLGFVKNVGNRYNNLYPKAWRIRMDLPGNFKKLKEQ